jgi:hypothetical protein
LRGKRGGLVTGSDGLAARQNQGGNQNGRDYRSHCASPRWRTLSSLAPDVTPRYFALKQPFEQGRAAMDFDISPKQRQFLDRVVAFMDEHIAPAVPIYNEEMNVLGDARWKVVQVVEELKEKAKAAGLWNFFMPPHSGQTHVDDTFQFEGIQLTNLEYSMIAEQMGKIGFASEVFNCSAPDTGNMEVLMRYGTL